LAFQSSVKDSKNTCLVFWRLLRPHTLTASFVPVLIGSALAWSAEQFRVSLAVMMLLASLFLQSAVNMFNEYYDYRRGLDHKASVGIGGAIVRDGMHPERVFQLGVAFGNLYYAAKQLATSALGIGLHCYWLSLFRWALSDFSHSVW